MKINSFKGLISYITGGSSGIGLAIAKLLASKGSDVVIFSRRIDALESAVTDIKSHCISEKQRISFRVLDVSKREMALKILPDAVKEYGPPDILINSAGISYPQEFVNIPYDKFNDIIQVNLYGTWNTIDILLHHLKAKKGYIVNVSSIAGLVGIFGMTAYSASKYAVIGFSEALRSELKRYDVTVSVLCPPDVRTPMLEKANKIKPQEAKAISAAAVIMEPEDVAKMLIKTMAKGDFLIIPNASGRFTNIMKRFFPGLTEWVIDRKIKGVRKRDNYR
ncbi:MAG: SDR family oxidoreductase [Chloroflexi bacterium]|nr:SDR family oxidoreductase [Chloroflexota bacterium]